jgi:hypothetical protein
MSTSKAATTALPEVGSAWKRFDGSYAVVLSVTPVLVDEPDGSVAALARVTFTLVYVKKFALAPTVRQRTFLEFLDDFKPVATECLVLAS